MILSTARRRSARSLRGSRGARREVNAPKRPASRTIGFAAISATSVVLRISGELRGGGARAPVAAAHRPPRAARRRLSCLFVQPLRHAPSPRPTRPTQITGRYSYLHYLR
ncbi:hypothetical protein EVAR_79400_1 [Eumeta japonica]|uniref:Uncharacterized protein n=1 Tax=Eumeta variegata TaxID=151549 RepID=A0A4C1VGN4_EUMVA|nr:hypothetical protein EVAR_79400_1 [Eumeta japonica]